MLGTAGWIQMNVCVRLMGKLLKHTVKEALRHSKVPRDQLSLWLFKVKSKAESDEILWNKSSNQLQRIMWGYDRHEFSFVVLGAQSPLKKQVQVTTHLVAKKLLERQRWLAKSQPVLLFEKLYEAMRDFFCCDDVNNYNQPNFPHKMLGL